MCEYLVLVPITTLETTIATPSHRLFIRYIDTQQLMHRQMDTDTINATEQGFVTHNVPLWHHYLLVGISFAFQNAIGHPTNFVQTLNTQYAFLSKMKTSYMTERELARSKVESPVWVATGPCGAAKHSSEGRGSNLMQIKIAVNELFHVNVTVLQQIMAYVHPDSDTNCVAIASGDRKIRCKRCGTGGKYYHLIEHYVVYVIMLYNDVNHTVILTFMYQATDAGAMDSKYLLPDFITLHMNPHLVFAASEALRYKGRQLLLWTFSSLDVLHTISVHGRYICGGLVLGHNKATLRIWDGTELASITAVGIISDLTMLQSAELCEHKDPGRVKYIFSSGSIGSLTIGLDYRINTTSFHLYMEIISTLFMCTPPICVIPTNTTPMPPAASQYERFSIVLENTSRIYIHSLFLNSDGQFPVLTIDNVTYETNVPVNTSRCSLGALHIIVPGNNIMTFCSKIQLPFLLKTATFGGIHFSTHASLVIKNHGRFGRISVNYRLSFSDCEGIINICDKLPAQFAYQNANINGFSVRRKKNACIIIYSFPSDVLYKPTWCAFLAYSVDLYDRNKLTLKLSETMKMEKPILCTS